MSLSKAIQIWFLFQRANGVNHNEDMYHKEIKNVLEYLNPTCYQLELYEYK